MWRSPKAVQVHSFAPRCRQPMFAAYFNILLIFLGGGGNYIYKNNFVDSKLLSWRTVPLSSSYTKPLRQVACQQMVLYDSANFRNLILYDTRMNERRNNSGPPTYNLNYTVKAKNITFSVSCRAGTSEKERNVDVGKKKSLAWRTAIAQYL